MVTKTRVENLTDQIVPIGQFDIPGKGRRDFDDRQYQLYATVITAREREGKVQISIVEDSGEVVELPSDLMPPANLATRSYVAASLNSVSGGVYQCDADLAVGKIVYVDAPNHVAKADPSLDRVPGIGAVHSKLTDTSCLVRNWSAVDGYSGLTPGSIYYLIEDGDVSETEPDDPTQIAGIGVDEETLFVCIPPSTNASGLPAFDGDDVGKVLGIVSGPAVEWISSSSGAHTSGTLAARPSTPATGDTYVVTSGVANGDRYACFVAGAWVLVSYNREYNDDTPSMLWSLNETTGTYASRGTHNIPLTVVGGLDVNSLSYDGRPCPWCVSDGNQYAAGPSNTMGISTAPTALTLAAWVRARSVSGIRVLVTAQYGSSFSPPYGTQLAIKDGVIRGFITKAGSYQEYTSPLGITASDQWQLVGWSYAGGVISYFLNGESSGVTSTSGGAALDLGSNSRWAVCGSPGGTESPSGAVAGVRVYDSGKAANWWRNVYSRGVGTYPGQ